MFEAAVYTGNGCCARAGMGVVLEREWVFVLEREWMLWLMNEWFRDFIRIFL